MLSIHPTTGIKVVKKTGIKPLNSFQANALGETTIFEGQSIIDDETDQSSTTINRYGISKIDGYIAYIPTESLPNIISKSDYKSLEVRFCENDLHQEKDYSSQNNIVLKVEDIFKPNHIILDYVCLICTIE